MNKKILSLLCIIVLSSGMIGSLMLTSGHSWGDDFAAYILQAQSLARGHAGEFVQGSTFTIEKSSYPFGPITVPWGFPILLAPVYAIFGMNILAFKAVLIVCYAVFLVAFFFLARTRCTDAEALLLTAFLAYNLVLLRAQNEVMSDVPFLMWSTMALWLLEKYGKGSSPSFAGLGAAALIGLATFAAAITRFNGLLLFLPLAATQIIALRHDTRTSAKADQRWPRLLAPYAAFGLCYGIYSLLLPSLSTGLSDQWQGLSLGTLWSNSWIYLLLPAYILHASMPGGDVLYVGLVLFLTFALLQRRMEDVPLALYGLATLALFIAFPQVQGPRYIFPILPIFFLLAFQGMKAAAGYLRPERQRATLTLVYALWAAAAALSLGASLIAARSNVLSGRQELSGPLSSSAGSMFSFIRSATPAHSVIIFFKPRAMRLMTDRDSLLTTHCDDLTRGNYVVLDLAEGDYNQISPARIDDCRASVSLTKVFSHGEFDVYSVSPRP